MKVHIKNTTLNLMSRIALQDKFLVVTFFCLITILLMYANPAEAIGVKFKNIGDVFNGKEMGRSQTKPYSHSKKNNNQPNPL